MNRHGSFRWAGIVLLAISFNFAGTEALAAIPKKISKAPRYNVNMRIGLKGAAPFSVSTVAKSGKKNSITEISSDGQTETLVEMVPRKSSRDNKEGLLIDVKVTRTVRGSVKATEKAQIFAAENEESELRSRGVSGSSLSLAVMANPISAL